MAAPVARKVRSRRRVAALNFLSNISLDGTHRDTKYAIFHKRGIDLPKRGPAAPQRNQTQPESMGDETAVEGPGPGRCPGEKSLSAEEVLAAHTIVADSDSKLKDDVMSKRFRTHSDDCVLQATSVEAMSYSGERPKQRRRSRLLASHSISEDDAADFGMFEQLHLSSSMSNRARHRSTSSSTSSVSSSSRPTQKEVRFQKPGKDKVFRKERVVLVSACKAPFVIYSALAYSRNTQNRISIKEPIQPGIPHGSVGNREDTLLTLGLLAVERVEEGQDVSYSQFLVPSRKYMFKKTTSQDQMMSYSAQSTPGVTTSNTREVPWFRSYSYDPSLLQRYHIASSGLAPVREKDPDIIVDVPYNPDLLDDPELRSGKHRTLMTFPSYVTSVIDYAKPSELKKELNEKFREKFPQIQLTLSKLRSLKRILRKIAYAKCGLDLWSVAQAYVYFEKVILKGLINKPNRKLVAAVCMMLSAKLNDVKGQDLTRLIEEMEDSLKLHRRDLLAFEFGVLVALEFSLLVPDVEVYQHYQRLLYTS